MKIICRAIVLNFLGAFFIGNNFNLSVSKPFLQMNIQEVLFVLWVTTSLVGGFWFLGYVFYHWGTRQFVSKKTKTTWFWILLIGLPIYLIGPLAYYLLVCELDKGIANEKNKSPGPGGNAG